MSKDIKTGVLAAICAMVVVSILPQPYSIILVGLFSIYILNVNYND